MGLERTRDVLDKARAFHRELSAFYRRMEDRADRERVKLLLDYLSGHERKMEERLAQFEETAARRILDTWYKYAPGDEIREALKLVRVEEGMTAPEIICMALRLDENLLRLYRRAAELAPAEPVRQLFQGLYEEGKKERAHLVLAVFELQ